ncbi:uncharacterized protein EI90DRAFT_3052107 [Cantharellus anzutake]|uniref:uncharacterized protein n=1 Tax=Cantharellus anzutake TaxID=1750568 RepID=UPI0019060660|nr:uncharacterized protein EI90DRAFT_3052107 [Cantharellus anzutake]KAF8333460.1 hypothetical protein EI90DRAFT_3052107 [Cantharellus anzutake]
MMCNVTRASVALPILRDILDKWQNPSAMIQAPVPILTEMLKPIGLHVKRASRMILLSHAFLVDPPDFSNLRKPTSPKKRTDGTHYPPTPISHLPGVGPYALDSFRIFSPYMSGGGAASREKEALALLAEKYADGSDTASDVLSPSLGFEEWKNVTPSDKELARYMVSPLVSCHKYLVLPRPHGCNLDMEMGDRRF